ncbi:trypsin-like peptidase domain-containing protein [Bacillus sp. H-16]|uniref:trypsin-like peptidase domain-containing protein n=1 Tax=Alteribacter salitolerans TaxID=2912333 RepID=UPI0019661B09|nr:trypsin-like peptidase domain-containing protein [Alteribacter salitolerans]
MGGGFPITYREDKDTNHHEEEERPFFDGERYYTKEEFFNPEDEDEEPEDRRGRGKGFRTLIAVLLVMVLIGNVFAFLPRLINIPAMEFLQTSRELSQNDQVQLYKESVVVVRGGDSKGTGFLFSEDGYIMTNDHVVANQRVVSVSFEDGSRYQAEVIHRNEELDIAVLNIDLEVSDRSYFTFSDSWVEGEDVYVIGNPLFFNFIANEGQLIGARSDGILMLDAPVYRGNSGSPVINQDGDVTGVVYATTRTEHDGETRRVGLIVPSELFLDEID